MDGEVQATAHLPLAEASFPVHKKFLGIDSISLITQASILPWLIQLSLLLPMVAPILIASKAVRYVVVGVAIEAPSSYRGAHEVIMVSITG